MRRARVAQKAVKILFILSIALKVAITWGQGQVILRVPQDFPTIEEAIAAALPGATIQIAEGTYRVQLVLDKDLTLEGLSDTVILRASTVTEPIVRVQGSANVTLRRLVLDDGTRSLIVQDNAIVTLDNAQIRDATLSGVLVQNRGQLVCSNSKILENHGRGGITAQDQSHLFLNKCTVRANNGEGVFVMGQARAEIRQSLFERNRGAALVLTDDAQARITATRFTANNGLGIRLQERAQLSIHQSDFFSNKHSIDVQDVAYLEAIHVHFRAEERGIELRDQAIALVRECEFAEGQGIIVLSSGSVITVEANLFRKGEEAVTISSANPETRVILKNNTFEDRFLNAVEISSDARITLEGNRFERNFEAISGKFAHNLTVRNNKFFDNYRALGVAGFQIVVEDNLFEGNWIGIAAGVDDRRGAELLVRRNRLIETESVTIAIGGASRGMLSDNQMHKVGEFGIVILDEAILTLKNNSLSQGKRHGIVLSGIAQASLHGNHISDFEGCALYIGPKAKLAEEMDNSFAESGKDRCGRTRNSWQDRLEQAPAGSILEIPPGIYYESLWINKPIQIRSSGAVFRGNGIDPVISVTGDAQVYLEGLTLQEGRAGLMAAGFPPSWFSDFLGERGRQQLTLKNVKALNNQGLGIGADFSVTELIIENSEARDNGIYGVRFHGSSLRLAESTIAGHETGLFLDLSSREAERPNAHITKVNFTNNQVGIEVKGLGDDIAVEESQINGGALGLLLGNPLRIATREQPTRLRMIKTFVHDHRQERATSFSLALLSIGAEFVGSGIAIFGSVEATLLDNEIAQNKLFGVIIGAGSSVSLQGNRILDNERYGVTLQISSCVQGLFVSPRFEGRIEGKQNTVPGPGESNANRKGAFCPKELEFLKTEQGGSYP